jgi:hypothetical protein
MKHENALALGLNAAAPAEPGNFSGTWVNEEGSRMTLTVTDDQVMGVYASVVGGDAAPLRGLLTGAVSRRVIAFSVNWQNGAITGGIGHLVAMAGGEWLETCWYLAYSTPNPDDLSELWVSVMSGTDHFHR